MQMLPSTMLDDLGPEKVILLREPNVGLEAFVVIDNVAAGPAIGGVRLADDVTVEEVARLARAMTLKNAAAGLPHGGAKAGIVAHSHLDPVKKEALVRAFAQAIVDILDYVPGPDMGLDERSMAWVHDEIGRAVGLPRAFGGIPLDEIGATGLGVVAGIEVAAERAGWPLDGARIAIEGFGAVGMAAARMLTERGAVLVAVSDSRGARRHPTGFDVEKLVSHKHEGQTVGAFPDGEAIDQAAVLTSECDILIPAARPDSIDADNAGAIKAKLVAQGANIPATPEAEQMLHERDVLVLPDFIVNAGGVICAAVEFHGGTEAQARQTIEDRIKGNVSTLLDSIEDAGVIPRQAATRLAVERVREAMSYRRRFS